MAVFQVKKYKTIKDENGNKIQVPKTTDEWNKETRNSTMTWYFSTRYEINKEKKQYKSKLFALKREAQDEERLFLSNPIEYIQNNSKRAKNSIKIKSERDSKILNDYFQDFFEYELEFVKSGSVYNYRIHWDCHISSDIGDLEPHELSFAIIKQWHKNANEKINPRTNRLYATKTKNTWHSTLSEFLNYLVTEGKIEVNYAKAIGGFKKTNINKNAKKEIKYQTIEEYEAFMKVVDNEFWYAFFNFAFWHGCRKGKQRALKIKDVDFVHDTIHFHSTFTRTVNGGETIGSIKNGKERITYIAPQSKPYLVKLVKFYQQMDGYSDEWFLFGGSLNTYKNRIDRIFKIYYNKLKQETAKNDINVLSHHEFGRHSHASYLLDIGIQKGLNREEVYSIIAQRLGDTVDVIKNTYAHPYESANLDKSKQLLN